MKTMKVKDFTELVSKTQDNNVLTKGFFEDDYLSLLIIKAIKNNTNTKGEVDINAVHTDLSYANDQIYKALTAVQNLTLKE